MSWRPITHLSVSDLETTPVWEWRERNGLEECRPTNLGSVPEADGNTVHIAHTRFMLSDGTVMFGYCSPGDDSSVDYIQPMIINENGHWNIWEGKGSLGILDESDFPLTYDCLVPSESKYLKRTIEEAPNQGPETAYSGPSG